VFRLWPVRYILHSGWINIESQGWYYIHNKAISFNQHSRLLSYCITHAPGRRRPTSYSGLESPNSLMPASIKDEVLNMLLAKTFASIVLTNFYSKCVTRVFWCSYLCWLVAMLYWWASNIHDNIVGMHSTTNVLMKIIFACAHFQ
jgi:hypothetical protein